MPFSTKSTIASTSSTPGISCPVMARMHDQGAEQLDRGGHRGVRADLAPADRALEDGDGILLRALVGLAVERGDALVAHRLLDRGPDVVGAGRRVHEGEHRGEHRPQVPADRSGVRRWHLVAVELLHRSDREVLLARPAPVDGRLADARGAGHLVHGHAVEAAHQDERGGCGEDPPVCLGVARTAALAAYLLTGGVLMAGPTLLASTRSSIGSPAFRGATFPEIGAFHPFVTQLGNSVTAPKHYRPRTETYGPAQLRELGSRRSTTSSSTRAASL